MCRSAVIAAIRPTACREASTTTTNSTGITACIAMPSASPQDAAALNAIVASVSSQAVCRSSGNGIRSQVSTRSSESSTTMPASTPIGKAYAKAPKPFSSARSRTELYDPAKPMPEITHAPTATTPSRARCARVREGRAIR